MLIDESLHVWLVELNANPSLNVYNDNTLPNGDIEQTLSELDKYIKTSLIADTLKIITTPREQQLQLTEHGCLKRILPSLNTDMDDLKLYCHLEQLFEFLSGNQNYDFLTVT